MPLLIIQLAILVAVAFIAGCVLGRLIRRRNRAMTDEERTIVAAALSTPAADATPEPVQPSAPKAVPFLPEEKLSDETDISGKAPVPDAEVVGDWPVKTAEPEEAAEPEAPGRPVVLDAPRGGKADDLTAIDGIGKAVAGLLNGVGVFHYDQIAGWTLAQATWIERRIGFPRRIERENWTEQAAKLIEAASKATSGRGAKFRKTSGRPKAGSAKKDGA